MKSAEADSQGLGGTMKALGKVSAAALVGMGIESVKMATAFQSSTVRLATSAGEQVKNLGMIRKGLLDMAGQVGVSATDLSKSLYFIEAAGFHAADGLTVLKAAAQGAAAEGANTTTVGKALTDVLVDYHLKASDAANVTSQLITAVAHGKTNLQEFSGSFASIIPAASAAGISFQDVSAALSEMTNHGFTAQRASQNLSQALRSLLNPTKSQQKAFAEFGVSTGELRGKLQGPNGLTDAMQYLSEAASKGGKEGTPQFAAALKLLMGTAAGANAALATTGQNFKSTSTTIRAVGGATADASGKVQGFAEVQKTLGQQVKQLSAGFGALLIALGQKLIPILTTVVTLINKHQTAFLILAGTVTTLVTGIILYSASVKTAAMVTGIWNGVQAILNAELDANPIGIIILAIAALVIGLVEAYKHSKTFRDILHAIGTVAANAFKQLMHWAEVAFGWIRDHWRLLLGILTGPIGIAVYEIAHHWHSIMSGAQSAVRWIESVWRTLSSALASPFVSAYNTIRGILNSIFGAVSSTIGTVSSMLSSVSGAASSIGHALGFAHGGTIGAAATGGTRSGTTLVGEHGPELVHLPAGSHVFSNPDTRAMMAGGGGGGGGGTITLELHSGGSQLDNVLLEVLRKSIRVRGGNVQTVLGRT